MKLCGEGSGTILRLATDANTPVIVLGQITAPPAITTRNIHVSDLTIDGNRLTQAFECWGGDCDHGGLTNSRNNGIMVGGVSDVIIENITVHSTRSGGLVSEKGSKLVTVQSFTSFDNQFDGLAAYKTEDSTFSGLFLYNNCSAGLSFDLGFNNNSISGVIIHRDATSICSVPPKDGRVGLFMINSKDNTIQGIHFQNSREHGVFLAQPGSDPIIAASGNTFTNLVVSNSGQDADPSSEGWCAGDFEGGVGFCVKNDSALNNLSVGAQFINDRGGCIKVSRRPVLDLWKSSE